MGIVISKKIGEKLASKHNVSPDEVAQCFANRTGKYLEDTREEHETDPPTRWFISETDYGRKLKVVFLVREGKIFLRTAYAPNKQELDIYRKLGKGTI